MALVYYPPLDHPVVGQDGRVTIVWRNYFQTLSGGITPGSPGITQLTGPITTPGGGSGATTITDGAVTYAKIQDVSAANRLLGRGDSGPGDVEEISLGDGLVMTGTVLSVDGSDAGGYWTVLTNGSPSAPELIFDADGDVVSVWVPFP